MFNFQERCWSHVAHNKIKNSMANFCYEQYTRVRMRICAKLPKLKNWLDPSWARCCQIHPGLVGEVHVRLDDLNFPNEVIFHLPKKLDRLPVTKKLRLSSNMTLAILPYLVIIYWKKLENRLSWEAELVT